MGRVGWSEGAEVGERVEGYRRYRRRHPLTISIPYLPTYPTLPIYPRRPLSSRLLRYVPTKKNVLLCNVARRCEIRGKRKTT